MRAVLVAVLLGVVSAGFALATAPAAHGEDGMGMPTLALTETAVISVEPDMATVTSGVLTQAVTAREALTSNNAAMAHLIELIKSVGITDRDIATSGFSVQPQISYQNPTANGRPSKRVILGYEVSNNVTVVIRDLDLLGNLLDRMVDVGSNAIGGISFDVSNRPELLDKARVKAVETLKARAELYARTAEACLSHVLSITESSGNRPGPVYYDTMAMAEAPPAVPVSGGSVGISMTESMTWEMFDVTAPGCR